MELEPETFNFAEDMAMYACDTSVETVMIRLGDGLQELMFLEQKRAKTICFDTKGRLFPSSEQLKHLGVKH